MGVTHLHRKKARFLLHQVHFSLLVYPLQREAVGTAVSTPDDILTRQQVNLIPSDDTSIAEQLITEGTGELDDRTDKTATQGITDTVGDPTQPTTVTKTASEVAQDIRDEALTKTKGTLSPDAEATAQIIKTEDLAVNNEVAYRHKQCASRLSC